MKGFHLRQEIGSTRKCEGSPFMTPCLPRRARVTGAAVSWRKPGQHPLRFSLGRMSRPGALAAAALRAEPSAYPRQ